MRLEKPVWVCDPRKHKTCPKTACQTDCWYTRHEEYAQDGTGPVWEVFDDEEAKLEKEDH